MRRRSLSCITTPTYAGSGQEMYVKLKLRPFDHTIMNDSGKIEPLGILPPETGEGQQRKASFAFFWQMIFGDVSVRQVVFVMFSNCNSDQCPSCTKPWDEMEFPLVDVGVVTINENLTPEELEFNLYLKCHEIDVIRATSASQSASIDHGRSLIYEICQRLRNNEPLQEAWRAFIEKSDVKVDLSCESLARNNMVDFRATNVADVLTLFPLGVCDLDPSELAAFRAQ